MNKENFSQQAYLLKCLMDNMTDHIYFKDLDSRFIMMNEAASRWQGNCAPDELVGTSDFSAGGSIIPATGRSPAMNMV